MRAPDVDRIGLSRPGAAPSRAGSRARGSSAVRRIALLLASFAALAIAGCGRDAGIGAVDPLCGRVSATRVPDDVRLARIDGQGPLFAPSTLRRHEIAGHGRDAVTGVRAWPVFEKRLERRPASARHVESVELGLRLAVEPDVRLAPRARPVGGFEWQPAGPWVEATRAGSHAHEVVFDLAALPAGEDAIEIGVVAYMGSASRSHAWESDVVRVPEAAVLVASQGVVPIARSVGPIAFRALACEDDACRCVFAEVIDGADERLDDWREQRLSLAAFAGRDVVLRFETEVLGDAAIDPGLWAGPALHRVAPEGSARRPNLLLISLDTLAADHLGLHGYARDTSPFIDTVLAPRATVFMQAIAPATTTAPSHMTLFTSLPPSVHGAVSNVGGRALPEPVPTLASTLRDAGFVTGAVTENGAITTSLGFARGFDHYAENTSVERIRPEGHIEATFEAGRDFARQNRGLPWFLFLHTYQVHHPYTPPPDYAPLFEDDGLDPARIVELFSGGRRGHHPVQYDREIRFSDDRLRDLFASLERDGLLDDTLVVVLADHGEAFLEHLHLGHGSDLHRETVHVPLILAGPGVPAGLRIEQSVGLADVMPTVLELLQVPAPPGLLGRSLVPLLDASRAGEVDAGRPIFSEAWQTIGVTRTGGVQIEQPTLAVRRGDFKLIRRREGSTRRHALYDLARDPFEQTDLLAGPGSPSETSVRALARLGELLDAYESENAARAAALGVEPDATPEGEIDPDRIEKLRALGYLE